MLTIGRCSPGNEGLRSQKVAERQLPSAVSDQQRIEVRIYPSLSSVRIVLGFLFLK